VYDGDGKRVKSTFNDNTTTTYFVGTHYEVTNPGANQTITKYYYAGAQRIAMRQYTIPQNNTLTYLVGDHLGSTSLTTDASGNLISELRYKAWGETRYSSGVTPTKYTYTGQYSYTDDFGMMFYNARFYDPTIGRFTSADSIVPNNIHGYDRYNYVSNRPTIKTDPTGHMEISDDSGSTPSCARDAKSSATSRMDKIPISKSSSMATYTSANIGLQKGPGWYQRFSVFFKGKYASEGPAKVTDFEMETTYGKSINNGKNGYGLGLREAGKTTPNQNDLSVAVTAMSTRIQVRLDRCQDTRFPCTDTDIFLGAALGGDNGISPLDLRDLGNGVHGMPDPITGIFPWESYLSNPKLEDQAHKLDVIQQFVDNVNYLQGQGAAVPDVNWTYVCGLLEK